MNSRPQDAEIVYAPYMEDMEELICRFTIDRKISYINPSLAGYFGTIPSEALGKELSSFIPPQALQALNSVIETLSPQFPAFEYEYRSSSAKGPVRQLWKVRGRFSTEGRLEEIQAVGRKNNSDKISQDTAETYRELSKKKLIERNIELLKVNKRLQGEIEHLQQIEMYYKDLFENASEIIYVHDMQGRPLNVNRAFMDFCGISSLQKIQNITIFDRLLPEYRDIARQMVKEKIIKNNLTTTYEVEVMSGDGRIFPMEISSRLIVKDGQPVAVQGIARDISERKLYEKTVRESEQRLIDIINFLPDATFVIDKSGRVIAWNKAIEDMTGITAAEMLGRRSEDYAKAFYAEPRTMLIDEVLNSNPDGSSYDQFVKDNFRISGESFCQLIGSQGTHLFATASPLFDSQGNIVGAIESLRDITTRKATEKALKESEAKFRMLTEMAPGFIFVLQDTRFRYANPTFKALLGYNNRQLEELDLFDIIHPDYRQLVIENALARQKGESVPHRYDIKVVNQTGQELWIDMIAELIEYEDKPAILGMGQDVTAIRELREAWINSEANFRSLADTAPALIYVLKGSRLLYVNKAFEEITGYGREDCLNMSAWEFIHPNNREWVKTTALARQRGEAVPNRYQTPMIHKDGHEYWAEFSVSEIEFDGKPAILGVAIDITEQKTLQSALVRSEANFRSLADTAPALIYVLKGSRLLYVNKAFEDITGYDRNECLRMSAWEFIHPRNRQWVSTTSLARQRGENVPWRYQTPMLHKDGHEYWAEFSVSEIEFDGEPAILGVAIDITEQKEAQDQISYLSFHDKLTGLYNRAYLETRQSKLDVERNMPLSVIIGDVNGLKMVNDAFGHKTGDYLLKTVADILISCCGKNDLIARWGGDEFVILLPKSDAQRAQLFCDRVREACSGINSFPMQVSISLGQATKTSSSILIEEIYKEAEDLMYRNKMLENRSNRSAFLTSLEKTLWVRSHETQEHTSRLRTLVVKIGHSLNLPSDELNNLTLLAALHDIGKIAIPNSILDKPGKLNPEEWELMKRHPEIGYRIALSCPELASIADAILAHHERWDGKGYPLGLSESQIPLISRIISLADAFDVMTTGRPYQPGISTEAALEEIAACAGSQFDPDLAQLFMNLVLTEKDIKPAHKKRSKTIVESNRC